MELRQRTTLNAIEVAKAYGISRRLSYDSAACLGAKKVGARLVYPLAPIAADLRPRGGGAAAAGSRSRSWSTTPPTGIRSGPRATCLTGVATTRCCGALRAQTEVLDDGVLPLQRGAATDEAPCRDRRSSGTCAACAYRLEIGRDLKVPPTPNQSEPLEHDHLFPIEPYTKPTPRDRGGS